MQGVFNVINFELQNISSLRNVMNAVEDLSMHLRRLSFVNLTQKCHLTIFVFLNIYVFQWGTF